MGVFACPFEAAVALYRTGHRDALRPALGDQDRQGLAAASVGGAAAHGSAAAAAALCAASHSCRTSAMPSASAVAMASRSCASAAVTLAASSVPGSWSPS